MNSKSITIKKNFSLYVAGSFTIEAALVVPIIFLLTASVILISFNAHNALINKANEIVRIISFAPDVPEDIDTDLIDVSKLNGRQTLLQYRLLKEGVKKIAGGSEDE